MALVVNTNIASLQSQYSLSQSRSALEQAMERLSSGSKINSAGDDAAGLSIATRMESQVRGLQAAISNANDGISLLQTAEGAMEEISSMLQRMRELAIQSSNGVNTQADRDALNAEAQQLLSEIDRVVGDTTFNKQNILDGSMNTNLQIGSEGSQSLGINLGNLSTYALGADVASTSAQVQREASFQGAAVGSTDQYGDNLVTATTVNLTFEADDTYNFALTLETKDNDGNAINLTYDIEGVVSGGSARDIASAINTARRQPPVYNGSGNAGDPTIVYNAAADLVDVSYNGNNVVISNNLGGDVKVEAGNYATSTGIGSSLSGPISQSGGQVRFTPVEYREADGSAVTTGLAAPVVLGNQPDYNATSFTIQSAPDSTSGSSTSTTATAATLEVAFADINDATYGTFDAITDGDTIAFTLVDADGGSTLVYTDNVNGLTNSTNIVAALNNALIAAGADDTYSVAWGDNAALGGTIDGNSSGTTETTAGTFVITRADGTNFSLTMGGVDSSSNALSSSFATTEGITGVETVGLMKAVVDMAQTGSTYETSDGDITINFADTVAGSVGASTILQASDGFTLTLTDSTGTARSITVNDLQNGSAATVVAALNNAFSNAGITDEYSATVDGSTATSGITISHGSDRTFTLAFSDLTLAGATTGITTVIHEELDDLEFSTTANASLYSTDGVKATVAGTSTVTDNAATMYLDVLGADSYTLSFAKFDGTNTTSTFSHSYDGTAASLTTFASKIAANLNTMAGFDYTVSAEDGRIAIVENEGTGFKVNSFASTGAGRIFASADSSLIASGDASAVMLDDTSYATNATADSGAAGVNVTETQVKLTFTANATDTYSFTLATDDGTAKVNAFQYGSTSQNADAVAAITVALQSAGLDGKVAVEATGSHGVILTVEDGTELSIEDFTSVGSGTVQAESLAGTYGSGVTRILQDDVYGSANSLANLDLSTVSGATAALDSLDRALQGVSNERAEIGALTNRLDYTVNNLGNIVVNTSAAQSRIQDADFAAEAAELAKAQVLQQAGTAILAQANASVQSVLSLLG